MTATLELMPQARTDGLIVQRLPDEVLVYDQERHRAHCLNAAAALLWAHCDGRTLVGETARRLGAAAGTPPSEDAVWLGLRQLDARRLLAPGASLPAPRLGRREMLRRLGVAAALPLVTSIVAPTAASAVTCPDPMVPDGRGGCVPVTPPLPPTPPTPPASAPKS